MSVTVQTPTGPWARAHRAALVITVLSVMLAASLAVLGLRLAAGSGSEPGSGGAVTLVHHLDPVDNACQLARPGQPC